MAATVLDGTAPAALVVVQHSLGASAWPVVRELVARAGERSQPQLFIRVTSPADALPISGIDLTTVVPGFSNADVEAELTARLRDHNLPGGQIIIDALDTIAEDYGSPKAVRILRSLQATTKPGRVVLILPPGQFLTDILAASISPSAAHLTPHPAQFVESLAKTYLLNGEEEKFFPILESAAARRQSDSLALASGTGGDKLILQVLLRKPAGGAKGIVRELVGLAQSNGRWGIVGFSDIVNTSITAEKQGKSHADLNLPFNLNLTEEQRANRGAVPLPYAHEGEGADLSMGMDWEDDEEDDEF